MTDEIPYVQSWHEPSLPVAAGYQIRALDQNLNLSEPAYSMSTPFIGGVIKSGDVMSSDIGEGVHIGARFDAYGSSPDYAGDVTVNPGITIGNDVTLSRGYVVTSDLPDNFVG